MAVFTLFADLVSVLDAFLSELKEPLELVIIVFLTHIACGKHIINFEINDIKRGDKDLLAAVDKLASVHALGSQEQFFAQLILVGIAEDDLSQWRSPSRVVNYFLKRNN